MKRVLLSVLFIGLMSSSVYANCPSGCGSNIVKVPYDAYVLGGILGILPGFGIGHAVQGRYFDGGWAFTFTEAIGASLLVAGGIVFATATPNTSQRNLGTGLMVGGAIFYGGFKIWEILDVWGGAVPVDYVDDEHASLNFSSPSRNFFAQNTARGGGPMLGLSLSW
jgi:hypothetical protein